MKKEFKLIAITTAFFLLNLSPAQAKDENFFDLFVLADNLFTQESKVGAAASISELQVQNQFLEITQKFNQGNVFVAYDDYLKLIPKISNDLSLLNFSRFLYKNGFFSLAEITLSKIENIERLKPKIDDLKKSYGVKYVLDKTEEIFLARALSSIYYDNSALEVTYELNKREALLEKSDYANYIMAQAFYEMKQYPQALNYIKNAISLNPQNVNYNYYRAKILTANKNYPAALKIVENKDYHNLNFRLPFMVLREQILSQSEKTPAQRKYHSALETYYNEDHYKTIINARAAFALDKKNFEALNLLAKSQLKIGEVESARSNFTASNHIKKNNKNALIGLGDCEFIDANTNSANVYYKKAYSKDNLELVSKLALVNRMLKEDKALSKYENVLNPKKNKLYFENYEIATTLLNNIEIDPERVFEPKPDSKRQRTSLQNEYLRLSLFENPFYSNAWLTLSTANLHKENLADNFIKIATLGGDFDYFYYYNLALHEYSKRNYEKTLEYLSTSSFLNPYFEPASQMLLNFKIK